MVAKPTKENKSTTWGIQAARSRIFLQMQKGLPHKKMLLQKEWTPVFWKMSNVALISRILTSELESKEHEPAFGKQKNLGFHSFISHFALEYERMKSLYPYITMEEGRWELPKPTNTSLIFLMSEWSITFEILKSDEEKVLNRIKINTNDPFFLWHPKLSSQSQRTN